MSNNDRETLRKEIERELRAYKYGVNNDKSDPIGKVIDIIGGLSLVTLLLLLL